MATTDTLREQKNRLREQLKQARAGLSKAERQRHSEAITRRLLALPVVQKARTCFVYVDNGSEVATAALIDQLGAAGKTLYVPKILSKTGMIACPFRARCRIAL